MIDVPEHAIQTFEAIHGLSVTIHDLRGSLWAYLEPSRFAHISPLCTAVKAMGGPANCTDFDIKIIRARLANSPDGFVKRCHAGLIEWVVPAYHGLDLEWVLFAGPCLGHSSLYPDVVQQPSHWARSPWSAIPARHGTLTHQSRNAS